MKLTDIVKGTGIELEGRLYVAAEPVEVPAGAANDAVAVKLRDVMTGELCVRDFTPDQEVETYVLKYFHEMLKFPSDVKPDLIRIFRHSRAIPQYEVTSGARFETVKSLQAQYPGLIICGNLRDGIGMAHRITQAFQIASEINQQ